MSLSERHHPARPRRRHPVLLLFAGLGLASLSHPELAAETAWFVARGMIEVIPLVLPGVALAAWITASGAGGHVAALFRGRQAEMIVAATVVGAGLPVCGVTVLPMMAGLLAAGVPLAPVMAFWLASPITGPAMISATLATLGWEFALGKTVAAIFLGVFGGAVTSLLGDRSWARAPLRSNSIVGALGTAGGSGSACCGPGGGFNGRIWREPARLRRFSQECWSIGRLILLVLIPAFAAEHLLNAWLEPDAIAGYVGKDSALAVPLAVVVGGPAYIDGYAALLLTRALMEAGMAPGAAMAFLVSGGVVSVWGAMAIFPVLRLAPFLLYLALAASGSMLAGWIFGAIL